LGVSYCLQVVIGLTFDMSIFWCAISDFYSYINILEKLTILPSSSPTSGTGVASIARRAFAII